MAQQGKFKKIESLPEIGENEKFSKRATDLLGIIVATRLLFVVVVAPISYYFWNRKGSFDVLFEMIIDLGCTKPDWKGN